MDLGSKILRIYKSGHTDTDKENDTWICVATLKKHMSCMVVFLIYTYFECVASVSFMKDRLRAENSHQRVCSLGNGVETIPTIYFPPSHHSFQHPAHIIPRAS